MIAGATTASPFARQLGIARNVHTKAVAAHNDAKKALDQAIKHATVSADLQAIFLERAVKSQDNADAYAKALRAMADIVATLPTLREAVTFAEASIPAFAARVAELEKEACYWCDGSGLYGAYTSHLQNGLPVCFKCHGTGQSAKARKAAAKA